MMTMNVTSELSPFSIPSLIENQFSRNNVAENDLDSMYHDGDEMSSYGAFDEFASYFASQEVTGLDAVKDNMKVKKSLKAGYQYDWAGVIWGIASDEDGRVIAVNELFKGPPKR